MEVYKNFYWDTTERQLVVFLPCYYNIETVKFTVGHIATVLEPWDYLIIIGNDGFHYDWDDFCNELIGRDHPIPVKYLSMLHDEQQPRNGAFIRNYVLKRCMSKYFFQKDGEVCLEGDSLWNAQTTCKHGGLWRPGNIIVLDKDDSVNYMESCSLKDTSPTLSKRIEPTTPIDAVTTKNHIIYMNGQVNFTSFFHYAYCAPTSVLQGIHGYDEDFKYYGYEDSDMFCRIASLNYKFIPDYKSYAIHLWHESTVNTSMLMSMGKLFESKNPNNTLRNEVKWGEGA